MSVSFAFIAAAMEHRTSVISSDAYAGSVGEKGMGQRKAPYPFLLLFELGGERPDGPILFRQQGFKTLMACKGSSMFVV